MFLSFSFFLSFLFLSFFLFLFLFLSFFFFLSFSFFLFFLSFSFFLSFYFFLSFSFFSFFLSLLFTFLQCSTYTPPVLQLKCPCVIQYVCRGRNRLWTRTLDRYTRASLPECVVSRILEPPAKTTHDNPVPGYKLKFLTPPPEPGVEDRNSTDQATATK